jgi:hypothetical protein
MASAFSVYNALQLNFNWHYFADVYLKLLLSINNKIST